MLLYIVGPKIPKYPQRWKNNINDIDISTTEQVNISDSQASYITEYDVQMKIH